MTGPCHMLTLHSLFQWQKDPEKGGPRSFPQGGQLQGPGYCTTLWHCPGCVLCRSWRVPAGVHPLQHLLCINKMFPSLCAASLNYRPLCPGHSHGPSTVYLLYCWRLSELKGPERFHFIFNKKWFQNMPLA